MRLIKLIVPDDEREAVLDVLREENIDRVVTREASERDSSTLVEFALPTQAVGYALRELREAGFDDGRYTVIADAETAKTTTYTELEDLSVEVVGADALGGRRSVVVTVSKPANRSYPNLPQALATTIEDRTGTSVAVEVTVRDRRAFDPDASARRTQLSVERVPFTRRAAIPLPLVRGA